MHRPFKTFLLSTLLILCAPLGLHRAPVERDRESNDKVDAAETSLSRVADFNAHLSVESSEISGTSHASKVARQLQVIPFASQALFFKEYSDIEE